MSTITVAGITFDNAGARDSNGVLWVYASTKGWNDGPPTKNTKADRPWAQGEMAARTFRAARLITVTGSVQAPTRHLAANAQRALVGILADGTYGTFTFADADLGSTSASVRIEGEPLVDWNLPCDLDFQLTFYAPDPLKYGATITASTGLPTTSGGLAYPLSYPLAYGTTATGRITAQNVGSAATYPVFTVTGPQDAAGFQITSVEDGITLQYNGPLGATDQVVIDTHTGSVLLNGSDRRQLLSFGGIWPSIPAASLSGTPGTRTFAFSTLGSYQAAASLSASWAPAFW